MNKYLKEWLWTFADMWYYTGIPFLLGMGVVLEKTPLYIAIIAALWLYFPLVHPLRNHYNGV